MKTRPRVALNDPHPHMGLLISSYQDGLTSPAETRQVESHLAECPRCQAYWQGLQQVREAVGDLPAASARLEPGESEWLAILDRTVYRDRQKRAKKAR